MTDLESLPPDQRAAVQLLIKQGQTYEQLGDLLAIEADAVRQRAHTALQGLAPAGGPRLEGEKRARVSDYFLGQQSVAERESTRDLLAEDASARAWARSVADALRALGPDAVPEIPAPAPRGRTGEKEDTAPYAATRKSTREEAPRASRLGGALLLGGVAVVLAVVVILLVSGGDDGDGGGNTSTLSTNPTTQTSTQPAANQPVAQINLLPPGGGTKPVGLAQVFKRGQQHAIILAAQGVPAGTYALWLYNSATDARFLGFVPQRIGKDGRFATQGVLPENASRYQQLVVTSETANARARRSPTRPGRIVLQGKLALG